MNSFIKVEENLQSKYIVKSKKNIADILKAVGGLLSFLYIVQLTVYSFQKVKKKD